MLPWHSKSIKYVIKTIHSAKQRFSKKRKLYFF